MEASLVDQQEGEEDAGSSGKLLPQQFYRHDPLFLLLKDKLRLNDLWIIGGVMVFPASVFFTGWFAWISHVLVWTLSDTLSAVLTIVIFPLLFTIYLIVPASLAGLFNTLNANGVIGEIRQDRSSSRLQTYEDFLRYVVNWTDSGWWTAATLFILVLYTWFRFMFIDPRIFQPVPFWYAISIMVVYLPVMYAACMTVMRLLFALIFINVLFYFFTIKIKPLHPDGSGGLGPLGRILWISVSIMLWDALLIFSALLTNNLHWFSPLELILIGAIYVALTPSLLIGWLVFPHRVMVRERDKVLQPLADEFQEALLQSLSSSEHNENAIVAESQHLTALKQRYELVRDAFPTWPLEVNGLSRLAITVILPVLLPLLLPFIASLISFANHALGLP